MRRWNEWKPGSAVTVDNKPGMWRYHGHQETASGEVVVTVYGGQAQHQAFRTFPADGVRILDLYDLEMAKAGKRRAIVMTPRGLARLIYWAPKRDIAKVMAPTGEIWSYKKHKVTLAPEHEV